MRQPDLLLAAYEAVLGASSALKYYVIQICPLIKSALSMQGSGTTDKQGMPSR